MYRFKENFYPEDRIGYAYGIHHDTDNLHMHVFLLPRTEKGKRVGFSDQLKGRQTFSGHKIKFAIQKLVYKGKSPTGINFAQIPNFGAVCSKNW